MSAAAGEPRWGEARVRERHRRKVRRAMLAIGATLAVMAGVPFAIGLAEGWRHGPGVTIVSPAVEVAMALALAAIVAVTLAVGWRQADEVQRRMAANSWAAVGVVGFAGYPIAGMIERALALPRSHEPLFWLSLAAGVAAYAWQWVKGDAR